MNYNKSVEYINNHLCKKGKKNSLDGIRELLRRMGNPHHSLKCIHVAGTNGKGSTSAYIESILRCNGYKTGLFTSPYIEVINERIRINDENISDDFFASAVSYVKNHVDTMEQDGYYALSFFDILTAMCFYVFNEQDVDICIVETGIGGRYDSTNVINPIMCVITSIGYDHMAILGNTIDEIAQNKAGIIKPRTPVIIAPQEHLDAYAVILNEAQNQNAPLYNLDNAGIAIHSHGISGGAFQFTYGGISAKLHTPLIGIHQIINASVSFFAMCILAQSDDFNLNSKDITEGINQVKWYGRCEVVSYNPLTIIDGAHNEQSINALIKTIRLIYPIGKVNFVFAIQKSKNREPILTKIGEISNCIYIVKDFGNKFIDAALLKNELDDMKINSEIIGDLDKTLSALAERNDFPIIICGSLYLASPAKKKITENL